MTATSTLIIQITGRHTTAAQSLRHPQQPTALADEAPGIWRLAFGTAPAWFYILSRTIRHVVIEVVPPTIKGVFGMAVDRSACTTTRVF
jgi:hypothetical protein